MLQTEFPFTLPQGYVDADGNLHREGVMRLATAYDEIAPHEGPACAGQPRLPGDHPALAGDHPAGRPGSHQPKVIESLFAGDLAYLQDMYRRINSAGHNRVARDLPALRADVRGGARMAWGGDRLPLGPLVRGGSLYRLSLHWPYDQIMRLEHRERQQWVAEIAKINSAHLTREVEQPMTTVGANAAFSVAANLLGIRNDPYLGFKFLVEIEGLVVGGFSEVTGLQVETEVETYREGGLNEYVHKLAGPTRYPSNLVLKHGMTESRPCGSGTRTSCRARSSARTARSICWISWGCRHVVGCQGGLSGQVGRARTARRQQRGSRRDFGAGASRHCQAGSQQRGIGAAAGGQHGRYGRIGDSNETARLKHVPTNTPETPVGASDLAQRICGMLPAGRDIICILAAIDSAHWSDELPATATAGRCSATLDVRWQPISDSQPNLRYLRLAAARRGLGTTTAPRMPQMR